ncbi:hypothetical protein T05_4747 [Trichinella murrelli]|uniref:Uncharacterized protein n=1 Tax=Trichinella murrelli TaxID=144512 RepID=A0A0V0SX66_9BILA|nr:hypothetical protein T05_4747 [Trichinella murrelli]
MEFKEGHICTKLDMQGLRYDIQVLIIVDGK